MKALKFICISMIVLFVVSACDKNEIDPEVPVPEVPVIRDASFPELEKAIQGQWVLFQKEEEATVEKTVYPFKDTPFWLRFEDDVLSLDNKLNEPGYNPPLGDKVFWGEVSIQKEAYPCFFFSAANNHYIVREISDSLLVISDSDAKGVIYKFAKTKKSPLSGTNWILSALCSNEGNISPSGITNYTISFDEVRFYGRSFANSFGGGYVIDGSNICVLDGFITQLACACCECDLNDRYEKAAFGISRFDYTQSELKLFYSDTEYMLFYPDLSTD